MEEGRVVHQSSMINFVEEYFWLILPLQVVSRKSQTILQHIHVFILVYGTPAQTAGSGHTHSHEETVSNDLNGNEEVIWGDILL